MAVTPNGRTLYVLNSGSDTPIQVATNTAGIPIPVPHEPFILAVTPDGKTLYVTGGANLLIPIRTSTNHPGTPVAGRDQMPSPSPFFGAAIRPRGSVGKSGSSKAAVSVGLLNLPAAVVGPDCELPRESARTGATLESIRALSSFERTVFAERCSPDIANSG